MNESTVDYLIEHLLLAVFPVLYLVFCVLGLSLLKPLLLIIQFHLMYASKELSLRQFFSESSIFIKLLAFSDTLPKLYWAYHRQNLVSRPIIE